MALQFYQRAQQTAFKLLTKYGEPVTVTRPTPDNFNPETGNPIFTNNYIYFGVGVPGKYDVNEINGTTIQANDVKLTFYCTTRPHNNDIFELSLTNYTVISVGIIRVQGNDVIYEVQLRQ